MVDVKVGSRGECCARIRGLGRATMDGWMDGWAMDEVVSWTWGAAYMPDLPLKNRYEKHLS